MAKKRYKVFTRRGIEYKVEINPDGTFALGKWVRVGDTKATKAKGKKK